MAQYKIKKEYIHHVCSKSLTQILEQQEQKLKNYHKLPWYKKSHLKELKAMGYRINDGLFCEKHLVSCMLSEGNFVVMDEIELHKIQKLWKDYCYDLKK